MTYSSSRYETTGSPDASDWALLVGRIALAVIYVMSGFMKLTGFSGTAEMLGGMGLPIPPLAAAVTILFELGGAILVILGLWTRLGAIALFLFTIGTMLLVHNFWAYPEAEQQMQQMSFMKNLGLCGGFLCLAGAGGGRIAVDRLLRRR